MKGKIRFMNRLSPPKLTKKSNEWVGGDEYIPVRLQSARWFSSSPPAARAISAAPRLVHRHAKPDSRSRTHRPPRRGYTGNENLDSIHPGRNSIGWARSQSNARWGRSRFCCPPGWSTNFQTRFEYHWAPAGGSFGHAGCPATIIQFGVAPIGHRNSHPTGVGCRLPAGDP